MPEISQIIISSAVRKYHYERNVVKKFTRFAITSGANTALNSVQNR